MVYFKICFSSRNSFCEDFFTVFTPAIQIQNKKACNHKASLYESATTVFNFTRPLGVFHQEKIVFWLPSIIPYMARRQNFLLSVLQTCKGFCVFKISVIVHNRYCVKYSLSYTADYTGTCPENPVIFWLIRR